MKTYSQFLNEVFGAPVPWEWEYHQPQQHEAQFVINGMHFNVILHHSDNFTWNFMFSRTDLPRYDRTKDKYGILGTGEQFKVFSTVIAILKDFLKLVPLQDRDHIWFSAAEPSRRKLYDRMITLVQHELPGYVGTNFGDGDYRISRASLREHLHEKFLKGLKGTYGYTEIYQNPTLNELVEFGDKHASNSTSIIGDVRYGKTVYLYRGIYTDTDLYLWHEEKCEHEDAAEALPKIQNRYTPIYLQYYPETQTALISFSVWSSRPGITSIRNIKTLVKAARSHRAFKAFKYVGELK